MPSRFKQNDPDKINALIDASPFATLIAVEQGQPFVSHLPLLRYKSQGSPLKLLGHMARANPQWKGLSQGEATAVFHGPHAYISPRWYAEHDVPTWNYAVVHVKGPLRWIEDEPGLIVLLKELSNAMEGPDGWRFGLPDDLAQPGVLARAIIGFEIEAREVQAKFKLGQNRVLADRKGMREGLLETGDAQAHALVRLMDDENLSS